MTDAESPALCPEALLQEAAQRVVEGPAGGLSRIDALLMDFPRDPRLHFLRGSILATLQDYGQAREALAQAVTIAPAYGIARFQLGLLMFTSGDVAAAEGVWAPLEQGDADPGLADFVRGLRALARDEFADAADALKRGISANLKNAPLNRDMQLLIDEMNRAVAAPGSSDDPTSPTHQLLQQFVNRPTHH